MFCYLKLFIVAAAACKVMGNCYEMGWLESRRDGHVQLVMGLKGAQCGGRSERIDWRYIVYTLFP